MDPTTDPVDELRRECGYDPEEEGSVDDLIAYKDALEDAYSAVLALRRHQIEQIAKVASEWQEESEADSEYWSEVATGQDSEEAEASGYVEGYTAALYTAHAYLTGSLDHITDPERHSRDKLAELRAGKP